MKKIGRFRIGSICMLTTIMALPLSTMAREVGDIQWHGYLTSALLANSDGSYSGEVSNAGSTNDTRMGLNISTQVDESLRFSAQIKGKGTERFAMKLDWAFASYDIDEAMALRFGKIKYPVGMYNEFVDVGYTYPWIRPPEGFYNQDAAGPNLTRVSYQGFGVDYNTYTGDTELGFSLFGGVVDVPVGRVNQLTGIKFSVNMEDEIRFELAANTGIMEVDVEFAKIMDGERHTTYTAGIIVDLAHFILSSEYGQAIMGRKIGGSRPMDMSAGYVMMGYRMGEYMSHVTWEKWDVDGGWGQEVIGVGLRKELTTNSAFKLEVRQITPETTLKPAGGLGLFSDVPNKKDITMVGVAIEMVF